MNTVRIFIPRILPNVTNQMMKNTFTSDGLGEVINIDIRHRINNYNYQYAFAFLLVKLYDTPYANQVWKNIVENGSHQLVYDSPNYWELKNYIARDQREYCEEDEPEHITDTAENEETCDEIVHQDKPSWSAIVDRKYPKLQDYDLEQQIQKRVQEYIDKNLEAIIIQKVLEMPFPIFNNNIEASRFVNLEEPKNVAIENIQKICYELLNLQTTKCNNSQNIPSPFSFAKTIPIYNLVDDYSSIQNDIWNTVLSPPALCGSNYTYF